MINKETLTEQWIDKVSKSNRSADKILVEKVIRALLLLEGLSNVGLPFIFKGGTALMLLLNSAKRLSIDIDIIISKEPKNLEELLQQVSKNQGFNKVELQHRNTSSTIHKAHYKFFYTPVYQTHTGEDSILLDSFLNPTITAMYHCIPYNHSLLSTKAKRLKSKCLQ